MIEKEQKLAAAAVQEMLSTKGWEIISKELQEEGDTLNKKLILSDDIEKDRSLKADIRAIGRLIAKITAYSQIKT